MADNKRYNTNERIRSQEVRVITHKGENIGVKPTIEAIRMARAEGLDLVEIAPTARPPVVRILDFKKFLYEERKKTSAAKAHSKQTELKEFVFGPLIGAHDLEVRMTRARGFLKDKNRVKFTVEFAGRQMAHPEVGWEKIRRVVAELGDSGEAEGEPKMVHKQISVVFLPK